MSDNEIIEQVERQTGQSITRNSIYKIKQQIKRESYEWYNTLRQDQFAYIHEFKERINEIESLQKMHHEIIIRNRDNPSIQQTSLAELHRLNITLSNYFEVLPIIINGITLPVSSESNKTTEQSSTREFITEPIV